MALDRGAVEPLPILNIPGVGALNVGVEPEVPKLSDGVVDGAVKLNPVTGLEVFAPNWNGTGPVVDTLLLDALLLPNENVLDCCCCPPWFPPNVKILLVLFSFVGKAGVTVVWIPNGDALLSPNALELLAAPNGRGVDCWVSKVLCIGVLKVPTGVVVVDPKEGTELFWFPNIGFGVVRITKLCTVDDCVFPGALKFGAPNTAVVVFVLSKLRVLVETLGEPNVGGAVVCDPNNGVLELPKTVVLDPKAGGLSSLKLLLPVPNSMVDFVDWIGTKGVFVVLPKIGAAIDWPNTGSLVVVLNIVVVVGVLNIDAVVVAGVLNIDAAVVDGVLNIDAVVVDGVLNIDTAVVDGVLNIDAVVVDGVLNIETVVVENCVDEVTPGMLNPEVVLLLVVDATGVLVDPSNPVEFSNALVL